MPICVTVTLIDGLVLARSQFHHSANYRSVVAHGTARLVTDPLERERAFAALVDKVGPGRAADSRPPNPKELAQTALLALPLREVSAKVRTGGVSDDRQDMPLAALGGCGAAHARRRLRPSRHRACSCRSRNICGPPPPAGRARRRCGGGTW